MLKGIDISQRINYSCKDDKEPKTVFVLRPLSGLEMIDISKHLIDGALSLNGDYIIDVLSKAVVEIKNPDKKGDAVGKYISTLPHLALMELVTEVGNINNLTEEDQKN